MLGAGAILRTIALLVAIAVALLFAPAPSLAQDAAAPEQYNNTDQFGVDLVTGSYNFSFVEGSIGPANAGISLMRLWTRAGWQDNWSGDLRRTVEGSTQVITITFGGRSERFTLQGSAWVAASGNGATLTVISADQEWRYRPADGTVVTYKSPLLLLSSAYENVTLHAPSWGCSEANALACGVPVFITRPDALQYFLTWHVPEQCKWPFPEGEVVCTTTYRLTDVRSSTGFAIKLTYLSNQDYTVIGGNPSQQGLPPGNWWRREGARFFDLSEVQCTPEAINCSSIPDVWPKVSYAYPDGATRDVTLSSSGTWRFTTGEGGVTGVRRPGASSDTTTVSYTSDRVTSITADGATRTYSWSTSGGNTMATATDSGAGGGTTTVVTDPDVGRPTTVTNATSNTVSNTYDSNDRLTRTTRPEGNYINYTRDARGNVTETRAVAKSGSGLADIVTTANFDTTCSNSLTCNQPNYVIDALNNRTDYTYNSTHGGVTRIQMPAPVTSGTRPQIDYTYTQLQPQQLVGGVLQNVGDPVWKVTQVTSCATAATCSGTANETRVTIAYDSPNLLPTSVTTASGDSAIALTTAYAYDTRDNLVSIDGPLSGTADTTTFIVDEFDRRRGVIGPDPDGSGSRVRVAERYSFDAANRIVKVERGTVTAATAAALDAMVALQTLDVTYDANGNRVRETASSGTTTYNVIQYGYDAQQRPLCTALRMNTATWSSLPTDACAAATAGSDGPDRITRNTYDGNDRVTLVETGVGSGIAGTEVATAYTANGRIDHVRDGENNRTTYIYDGHDRLSRTRYPVATQGSNSSSTTDYEELSYDAGSRVTSRRLRDGSSIGLGYDNLGRLTSRDLPGSETDASYGYDLAGRMTSMGTNTGFVYDALGRTISATTGQGTVEYGYDAAGRRNRLDHIDSFYVTYDHDVLGNVTAIRENGATSGVGVLATYAYDSLGRRSSVSYGNGTSQSLTFDNADRLTTLANNLAGSSDDLSIDFIYNPASQIASQTRSDDSYAWTPTATDTTDTINGLNQIMENGLTTVTYDARGNLTAHGSNSYTYNADNLLMTGPNGGNLNYDALGRLNKYAATGTTTIRFNYDGINSIAEVASSGIVRRYVHGPGSDDPIVWYEGATVNDTTRRFLHSDERGSIVSVTDSSGTLIGINRYDEYGIPASTNIGRYQYTGQQWLGEIGLYHYKARMYAPHLGRFMQTDPIGYADGMNWYAYVGGDPVNFVDPLGLGKEGTADPCKVNPKSCAPDVPPGDELGPIHTVFAPCPRGGCRAVAPALAFGFQSTSARGNEGGGGTSSIPDRVPCPKVSPGSVGTMGELTAALLNPINAIEAEELSAEATTAAGRVYPHLSGANDIRDAYRHFYWSFSMAREFGSEDARLFGNAHEVSNPNLANERAMDTYNNAMGRAFARNPSLREVSARRAAALAITSGCLITEPAAE